VPSQLVFPRTEMRQCFNGSVNDDGIDGEPTEMFTLVITNITDGVTVTRDTTTVVISKPSKPLIIIIVLYSILEFNCW